MKFVQTGNNTGGSGSGTYDHNLLINRGMPDQHTIESITGLRDVLNKKYEKPFGGIPRTDLGFEVVTPHDMDVFKQTALKDVENDVSLITKEIVDARGDKRTLREYIDTKISQESWTGGGVGTGSGDAQVGYPIFEEFYSKNGQRLYQTEKTYRMGTRQLEVYADGLKMAEGKDYIEKDEHSIEFIFEPEDDTHIIMMVRAVVNSGLHEEYVANLGQTQFPLQLPYAINQNMLMVYRNGQLQHKGRDYKEINDRLIQFNYQLQAGELVTFHQSGASDPIQSSVYQGVINAMRINEAYMGISLSDAMKINAPAYFNMHIDSFITLDAVDTSASDPFKFENGTISVEDISKTLSNYNDFKSGSTSYVDFHTYPEEIRLLNTAGGEARKFIPHELKVDKVVADLVPFVNNKHQQMLFYAEEIAAGQSILRVNIAGMVYDLATTDGHFFSLNVARDDDGHAHLVFHEQGSAKGVSIVYYLKFNTDTFQVEYQRTLSDTKFDAIRPDIDVDGDGRAHVVFASKRLNANIFNIEYRTIKSGTVSATRNITGDETMASLNPRVAIGYGKQANIVYEKNKTIYFVIMNGDLVGAALKLAEGDCVQPDIDTDSECASHIVWKSKRVGANYGVDYCLITRDGVVGGTKSIASGSFICDYPAVGSDYNNIAHITFQANTVRADHENICYSRVYRNGDVLPFEDAASRLGVQFKEPKLSIYGDTFLCGFLGDEKGYELMKPLANYANIGSYDYVIDGGSKDAMWHKIQTTSLASEGTSVKTEYRLSDDRLSWSAWSETVTGNEKGQYLHVRVTLKTTDTLVTPTVEKIYIEYAPAFIQVQSTKKYVQNNVDSVIVVGVGQVTYEVSRDGGTTFVPAELHASTSIVQTPDGNDIVLRAKIPNGSKLESWGVIW